MNLLVRSYLADAHPETRIRARRIPAGAVPQDLADRLDRFERRFVRHVGDRPGVVRLHGRDYGAMFRSIGPSTCMYATTPDGHILGTACLSCVRLRMPRGYIRRAALSSNLQVLPEARHGSTLPRLVGASMRWTIPRAWAALSFLLEDSGTNPDRVVRRLGLPGFSDLGALTLVTFAADRVDRSDVGMIEDVGESRVRAMRRAFTRGMIAAEGGNPAMRSKRTPRWIALRDGSACGCIEDYDAAKTHEFTDGSGAMSLNHLTFMGFRDPESCGRLIRAAAAITADQGVPRLQLAIDRSLEQELVRHAGIADPSLFRARLSGFAVFGFPRAPWSLNSTEI